VLVSSRLRGEAIRYPLCRVDSSDVAPKLFCVVCVAQESGLEAGVAVRTAIRQPHNGACQQLKLSRQVRGLRDYSEAH
jgi:hypothetical protein